MRSVAACFALSPGGESARIIVPFGPVSAAASIAPVVSPPLRSSMLSGGGSSKPTATGCVIAITAARYSGEDGAGATRRRTPPTGAAEGVGVAIVAGLLAGA
jgi:hypothetical protein